MLCTSTIVQHVLLVCRAVSSGVKIGPCGTIICLDGTILGSDGHPTPRGFALNEDKTVIIDPEGSPIADTYSIGPNG